MDIEKDSNREAFEAWFESQYDAHFMQFALDLDLYVDKHTQTCWEAWQAAKAQAVLECTWVKNEDGYFDASCGQSFVFSEPEDKPSSHEFTHCCFCGGKLIEAQEPTND